MATKVVPMVGRMERRNKLKFGNNGNAPKRRALRTRAVKTVLRREAKKLGLCTYPDNDKRLKAPIGQWLLDLIWWDDRDEHRAVELAVECEWNPPKNEILHDFEKLLAIKSPLKLMIYRVRGNHRDDVREGIKDYLLGFRQHVDGERYLFCEFQPDWSCVCYLFRVRGSSRGRVKDVIFRNVFGC